MSYSPIIFFYSLFRLSKPPDYILMENVKGFETSDTRSGGSRNKKKATTMAVNNNYSALQN